MKKLLAVGSMLLLAGCSKHSSPLPLISPLHATVPHNQVIILAGQSNMVRFSQYGAAAFIREYAKQDAGQVTFIPCAVGGTYSGQWYPGNGLLENCIALAGSQTVTAIFYWQGESDAALNTVGYDQPFRATIAAFRAGLKNPKLPFIFAQLAVEDPAIFCPLSQWNTIKAAQASVDGMDSYTHMIVTDDVSALDNDPAVAVGVHLSPDSFVNVAPRFVDRLMGLN